MRFDWSASNMSEPSPSASGRGSGTGSPASLGATTDPIYCSGEDASNSFPLVLHAIISEAESDCIHWLPCGTRFVIANKDVFSRDILPQYFGGRGGGTTKFTSFTRRLKRWNFSRVPSGREMGAYYHEKFRRGDTELAKTITYPISKVGGKPSPPGSVGKGLGRPAISKGRRRASTGSMMPNAHESKQIEPTEPEPAALDCISPTPIRDSVTVKDAPLSLENDLSQWLTSSDFLMDGSSGINNVTPNFGGEPESASPNSFMMPPPPFPQTVPSMGSLAQGDHFLKSMSVRPVAMRRHSETMSTTCNGVASHMPMMAYRGGNDLFNVSTMTNNPDFAMGVANNISFASNTTMGPTTTLHHHEAPQPDQTNSSSHSIQIQQGTKLGQLNESGVDGFNDNFSMTRELSFGDLRVIDPFT